jgi:hypothetical protein
MAAIDISRLAIMYVAVLVSVHIVMYRILYQ